MSHPEHQQSEKKESFYTGKDDVRVRFETRGDVHKKPLLFLHGGGISPLVYENLLHELESNYYLIVPDLPGHRYSTPMPLTWGSIDLGAFFNGLLEEHNFRDVVVAGHSFGGLVSLYTALQSDRVERAVVFDSGGIPIDYSVAGLVWRVLVVKGIWGRVRYHLGGYYRLGDRAALENIRIQKTAAWRTVQQMHRCLRESPAPLSQMKKPLQVVFAHNDEIFSPGDTYAERFRERFPQAVVHVVSGNHDWPVYNASEAAAVINTVR